MHQSTLIFEVYFDLNGIHPDKKIQFKPLFDKTTHRVVFGLRVHSATLFQLYLFTPENMSQIKRLHFKELT